MYGAIADGVNVHLHARLVERDNHVRELLLIPHGLTVPALALAGGLGIGLEHNGAAALGDAVGEDLGGARRDHVALVFLEVLDRLHGLVGRHPRRDGGEHAHTQVELTLLLEVAIELRAHRREIGDAGDAVLRGGLLIFLDSLEVLLVGVLYLNDIGHQIGSRVDEVARRLAVGIARDDATRGVGRIVGNARHLECFGVSPA